MAFVTYANEPISDVVDYNLNDGSTITLSDKQDVGWVSVALPIASFEPVIARWVTLTHPTFLYMRTFVTQPHRGTEHAKIWPGIRPVTHKNFVFYFEVDDLASEVRILTIFFGGADHRQHIMDRLRR